MSNYELRDTSFFLIGATVSRQGNAYKSHSLRACGCLLVIVSLATNGCIPVPFSVNKPLAQRIRFVDADTSEAIQRPALVIPYYSVTSGTMIGDTTVGNHYRDSYLKSPFVLKPGDPFKPYDPPSSVFLWFPWPLVSFVICERLEGAFILIPDYEPHYLWRPGKANPPIEDASGRRFKLRKAVRPESDFAALATFLEQSEIVPRDYQEMAMSETLKQLLTLIEGKSKYDTDGHVTLKLTQKDRQMISTYLRNRE